MSHYRSHREEYSTYDYAPEVQPYEGGYRANDYGGDFCEGGRYAEADAIYREEQRLARLNEARQEEKRYHRNERFGELGATAAGGFALYEHHEAKVDHENYRRHKLEEELAGTGALGSAGYALYERHEKKEAEKLMEECEGGRKHHHHHKW